MPKATYMGQKILFQTVLFGKSYYWMEDGDGIVGVARILHEHDDVWSIGRVVTRPDVRSTGVAGRLMDEAVGLVEGLGARTTLLKAQSHLAGWYGRFGFEVSGAEFLEDDIPHVPMARPTPARTTGRSTRPRPATCRRFP